MDSADIPNVVYSLSQHVDQLTQGLLELQIQNDSLRAMVKDNIQKTQVCLPERFTGERSAFRQFRNACNLLFLMRPKTYHNEMIKVMTVISFLKGEPRSWVDIFLENDDPILGSVADFFAQMSTFI
ncbi:protein LDOC1-like [Bombina bombina]|uniref:protein LDOC1-like n=1 Tax=Bombina bombina TaxID=8345 RepID=UPI00235B24C1|nr:protein LDOC1-like [Bombina bombina]